MKTLLGLISTAIFLLGGTGAQAGLQEGISAYRHGNYPVALKELSPLAKKGEVKAQAILGEMYSAGAGVPQNHAKAAFWYRKAAEQGDAKAQTSLGVMYREGVGVPQDRRTAFSWLQKAAEQGHGEALYILGGMYEKGEGVPQPDLLEAYKCFEIAAAAGFEIALDNLEEVKARMSREQIEKAQSMAKEWLATHKLPSVSSHLK